MEKLQYYQTTIFLSMFLGYSSYYYNRKTFSFAMPSLAAEENLSKDSLGFIASAQMLAYAASKFAGAILSDYLSARLMFCLGLILTGMTNLVFASSSSVSVFAAAWFLNGLAQGGGWPSCAKLLKSWFPPSSFGTWWSVLSTSANVAGSVAPLLAAWIVARFDWRTSMVAPACVSFALAAVFFVSLKNSPSDVGLPPVNREKKDDEKDDGDDGVDHEKPKTSDLFTFTFLQLVCFAYLTVFMIKTCIVDWGQMYLIQECGRDRVSASAYTSCFEMGGMVGAILAGYWGDRMIAKADDVNSPAREGRQRNPRMIVIVVLMGFLAASLHLFVSTVEPSTSEAWVSFLGVIMGFCSYGPIAIFGVIATECAPPSIAGTAYAISSVFANTGAILAGLPFNLLASKIFYSGAFFVLEVALVVVLIVVVVVGGSVDAKMKVGGRKRKAP